MYAKRHAGYFLSLILLVITLVISGSGVDAGGPRAHPQASGPQIGRIIACADVTDDGEPVGAASSFETGTTAIWFLFTFDGMTDGEPWRREWLRGDRLLSALEEPWDSGSSGWAAYPLENDEGFTEGTYTFKVYVRGQLERAARVKISSAPGGGPRPTGVVKRGPRSRPQGSFGPIVFCEDVSDDGEPINPVDAFPDGATRVWAFFTFEGMAPGQPWGRYWELDGEAYIDRSDEEWEEEDESGWVAYSISDEAGLPAGEYRLTLSIEGQPVEQASVEVGEFTGPQEGYFGEIDFAAGMTADQEPVDPSRLFDYGVDQVYAVFRYGDMAPDQIWSAEWLQDGEQVSQRDEEEWNGEADGRTWLSLTGPDGDWLATAEYTLNLYLDGELARSASFVVRPEPTPSRPALPEEIVDPELMPAWNRLCACPAESTQRMAQTALTHWIRIKIADAKDAVAAYRYDTENCNTEAGELLIPRATFDRYSWDELASTLAHELWHATQMLDLGYSCGCTVQKEVEALTAELGLLRCLGRDDILMDKWSGAWAWYGSRGKFDESALWAACEEAYSWCPKYEP